MGYGVKRGCETFKGNKPVENDNITVCWFFIYISYNSYSFSKSVVLVQLIRENAVIKEHSRGWRPIFINRSLHVFYISDQLKENTNLSPRGKRNFLLYMIL